ncbi:MAG TPA: carboxylesterase family protein [Lacipirellulaceae bacterium]|nr:carboxylesterase family protein [Lacipirellulaceae bacterium]
MKYTIAVRRRGKALGAFGVAVLLFAACANPTSATEKYTHFKRTASIPTEYGPLRGVVKDGIREYLGIPFAAPPIGDLRWRPPQPHKKWTEVRDATNFGNRCPQLSRGSVAGSEDCLSLNVFAPLNVSPNPPAPVMVWIHGGAMEVGDGSDYPAASLVKQGVIVVTINYRLGTLGFFAVPSLDKGEQFGNYGLLDQEFALTWVKNNISKFGGDSDNITVFGQSTGGGSALALMASPAAKGLFEKAIIQSPARSMHLRLNQPSLKSVVARSAKVAKAVGCEQLRASCLRAVSARELIKQNVSYPTAFILTGTNVFPQTYQAAFESGRFNRVPVIIGNVRDERTFRYGLRQGRAPTSTLTAEGYKAELHSSFGESADAVLGKYPLQDYGSPTRALSAATSDAYMICRSHVLNKILSKWVPVYAYEFADRTAPVGLPTVSFTYGAYHTGEIAYLFHGYKDLKLNSLQMTLSSQMISYWTTFAKTGDPNSAESPNWPRYGGDNPNFQVLRLPTAFTQPASAEDARHRCGFWTQTSYTFPGK